MPLSTSFSSAISIHILFIKLQSIDAIQLNPRSIAFSVSATIALLKTHCTVIGFRSKTARALTRVWTSQFKLFDMMPFMLRNATFYPAIFHAFKIFDFVILLPANLKPTLSIA
jgi:hypothetical protein